MKKILLMGNPNVGKSAVFSRLTGVQVMTSNYPGTTVEFTRGYMLLGQDKVEVIDVPGTYTLEPTCKAEEVACDMLAGADLIINVVDATNLERNLYLTLELLEKKIPVIVDLNMWDDTKHRGITIDIEKLSEWLGVPVVPTVAVTGEGFSKLIAGIFDAKIPLVRRHSLEERWEDIGKVVSRVQKLEHRHHTIWDILQDLSIHPLTGLPIAAVVALAAFFVVRLIGEGLINYLADPFFNLLWLPLLMKLSALFQPVPLLHDIVVGKLIGGQIDFVQSMGVFSTALYVEFAMVLPYLIAFYFILGLLEDSGYLPRLAVLMDGLMHRVGLHGFAIVPTLLGFGCNVPGILATRILESKRERFIASTLISIGIPCAALQAMIFGVLGKYGGGPVAIVYTTLLVTWIVLGFILNKAIPGFSPELLLEIPPYRLPPLNILGKKLWWRIKGFLLDAVPIMLVGVLIVNIITVLGLFESVANLSAPVVTGLFGLPKGAVTAIVIGFLRKDIAIGMLVPLQLSIKQLIVACVVLSMFFPCIATFTVLLKELGLKAMLKSMFVMITVVLVVGSLLNLIL